jgi:hypothetical protein
MKETIVARYVHKMRPIEPAVWELIFGLLPSVVDSSGREFV